MLYKILKPFGPSAGAEWEDYLSWIHHQHLTSFESIDSMLRDECFEPETEEDWANCVNEDFKINFINNLPYAQKIRDRNPGSEIIGMDLDVDENYIPKDGFRGFDILDEWLAVSLITNWGKDEPVFETVHFEPNGLISSLETAIDTRDMLRSKHSEDPHARNCQVLAVYRVAA